MPLGGVLGERIAKSISLYESLPAPARHVSAAADDYSDMIPVRSAANKARPRIQHQMTSLAPKLEVVSNFDARSKSIDHGKSDSTSVMRKKGLSGALMEAISFRKRTGQFTQLSGRIPLRSSQTRSSIGSDRR